MIAMIFLVLAFVCFLLAAFWSPPKGNLIAIGLAAWVLSELLGRSLH